MLPEYFFKNHKYHSQLLKTLFAKETLGFCGFAGRCYQSSESRYSQHRGVISWGSEFPRSRKCPQSHRGRPHSEADPSRHRFAGQMGKAGAQRWLPGLGVAPGAGGPAEAESSCPGPAPHPLTPSGLTHVARGRAGSCAHGPSGLPGTRKTAQMPLIKQDTK